LAGFAAGRASGARVIAFTTTASLPDILAARPDWILKDCASIHLDATAPELSLGLEEVPVAVQ
jgi:beta-phosphoglucomutase-like phosphatase (HAD superfamily)